MLVYVDDKYKILKGSRGYTLINLKGEEKNHAHLKKQNTCMVLIKLIERQLVPKSKYLQNAALRLTTDEKYKTKIIEKQIKNKNKLKFHNVNNGINHK